MEKSGLEQVARYSLKPHELKICTPEEGYNTIYRWLAKGNVEEQAVIKILRKRKVAYSYLQLIAKENNIGEPFNSKVTEAYWIGNEFLDSVSSVSFREMIERKFTEKDLLSEKEARLRLRRIGKDAFPHHNFHVLVVGSVTGNVSSKLKSLELCRISWGEVRKVKKNKVRVEIPNLNNDAGQQEIEYDRIITGELEKGDFVTTHWGKVCERITSQQKERLEKYTKQALDILSHH